MTLIGVEGIHSWSPPDGSDDLEVNRIIDDGGDPVWPRYKVRRIGGLGSLGDSGHSADLRVGALGEIARRGFRRGKTTTYEGLIQGRTRSELRSAESALRAAFQSQEGEGRMTVSLHPDHPNAPMTRYFDATCITLELGDEPSRPSRRTRGWERPFVLALRWSDPRYFEDFTLAQFKQAIIDLDPALYWALDAIDGATDLSGNGRNGTASGGITIGGAAGLLAGIAGDSSTDFDGSNDGVTSSYSPFSTGSARTFFAVYQRDTTDLDGIFSGSAAEVNPYLMVTGSPSAGEVRWAPKADVALYGQWYDNDALATGTPTIAALTFDDAADEAELFVNGESQGVDAVTSTYDAAPGSFQLGLFGGTPFDGKMAHVAVFERLLTAQEIADLHEIASTGRLPYY